jgi:Tfp pilus assembly protein PilF
VNDIQLAPRDAMPKAKEAALKALEIDPELAAAHASMGMVKTAYDFDWTGAEREFRRALELDPDYATGHAWYGWYLSVVGRHEEAVKELTRARQLDPLSPEVNAFLGLAFHRAGRYEEAVAQLRKTLEMDPRAWLPHVYLGWTLEQMGRLPQAIAAFEDARGSRRTASRWARSPAPTPWPATAERPRGSSKGCGRRPASST